MTEAERERQVGRRPGRARSIGDVVGGFVAGLYSVPEGIGYASLAGLNPMLGIYAGMVPVAVAAMATGSVLMMSTLTSAIALTTGGILDGSGYTGAQIPQAVFTLTLLAGLIMAVLGALRLGSIVNYVSNAVMTGFVMGVAILILVGKFDDIFGYDPSGFSNKVVKAFDIVTHPGHWDLPTTAVGLATIAAAFGLKAVKPLERYALVIVVIAGTAVVWLLGVHTLLIADEATIPTGLAALPIPRSLADLPDPTMIPTLLAGSFSIAIVALAQGAGIRPAFPNPDGSRSSSSRDFLGQGLGNVAGAVFQAAPTGGSLSRTAVSADGGARTRVAGYVAAATVVVLVVFLGGFVGAIPEAVIGALLFVIGVELVMGRMPDARLALRTGWTSAILFLVTLVLTLTIPLQWAILAGAVLSLIAFVVASASRVDVHRVTRDDQGWVLDDDIPATLPSDEPLVLAYTGPDFFADVANLTDRFPEPVPGRPGVLVLDLGALQRFSSTTLEHIAKAHAKQASAGGHLVLAGVGDDARAVLARTGVLAIIGERNVLPGDRHLGASFDAGLARGRELLADVGGGAAARSGPA